MFLKIGLDIHGCIDKYPELFAELTKVWFDAGYEIHIVTGSMESPVIVDQLKEWNITYTHFYSISESLIEQGLAVHWSDRNNPWFEEVYWNEAKAKYCRDNQIDIHYDDSDEYGKHFTTPFVKVY